MRNFQFSCAVRITDTESEWDGLLMPIPDLLTPLVKAETPTEAINSLKDWCADNRCVIYEMVVRQ